MMQQHALSTPFDHRLALNYLSAFFFLVALSFLQACATNPVSGEQEFVLMSEGQELAIGRQAAQQVMQQYKAYADPGLQTYINTVGQRVAAQSHRADISYQFTLLDSTEINAFALPGGYIYITRGLLAYLNSEAELAAVLGHEIGHVTARHSVRQQTSQQATGIGIGLLSILLPGMNNPAVGQAANAISTALLRGYGREHELEADRLGAEYLARTNYDPQAMFRVVRALKNQEIFDRKLAQLEGREPRRYHGVFSTHPDNDTRLKEVIDYVAKQDTDADVIERDRFLDHIDGVVFGPNPDDGMVVGNDFLHPDLNFALTFSANWKIQNLPDRVVAVSPDRSAQIQLTLMQSSQAMTPEQVVEQSGVSSFSNPIRLNNGGLSGLSGLTKVRSQAGEHLARLSVIVDGKNAYLLTGVTKDKASFSKYDPTLLANAKSFRRLGASERKKIRPQKIRVVKLKGQLSWASLARVSPLDKLPIDHLKMLNGVDAGDSVPESTRIKIIE